MKLYESRTLTLGDIARSRFVVPPIQRDYVWSAEDARYLVESMAMGLPIGSVVLQRLSVPRKPGDPWDTYSVVDGQQRISSLKGATMQAGAPTHEICIDRGGKVVIGGGAGLVPITMMLDAADGYSALMVALCGFDPRTVDNCMTEFHTARTTVEITRESVRPMSTAFDNIRGTEIPALIFKTEATADDIAESFRRINMGGVPIDGAYHE